MNRKKAHHQYRGRLSVRQVADGMNAASRNARRLLEDAKTLAELKRYPTACSLAILSIEEAGKLSILRSIGVASHSGNDKELKELWQEYCDHQVKNKLWIMCDLVKSGARTFIDMRPVVATESDHTAVLDAVKQLGFYTDCCGKAHWSEPHGVITEDLTKSLIVVAEVLSKEKEITVGEIELWIEHWDGPMDAFHKAMIKEGLSNHTVTEIERFFGEFSAY